MDSSAAQISTTMTINTYGANEIRPPAPPLRNKGRVNHTVGVNRANNASAPIATECVKVCDSSTSTEIVQPIKISNDTNAGTNAIEIKRIGNLVSDFHGGDSNGESDTNNRDAMYQCSQSQVSASPQSKVSPLSHDDETPRPASPHLDQTRSDSDISFNANKPLSACATQSESTSAPERKYKISQGKLEQRYDMNMVPKVKKNPDFLRKWRSITTSKSSRPVFSSIPNLVPCDTASNCDASTDSKSTSSEHLPCPSSSSDQEHHNSSGLSKPCPCHVSSETNTNDLIRNAPYIPTQINPFAEDAQSCIWVPTSRSDWEDSIDELVNICTAAAWHKYRQSSKKKKEFSPPISHIYVKDRIDIDDPLRGYQIRHKTGGWLQGFIMMTDFTIWTHYFKWDSNHPMNGIDRGNIVGIVDDGRMTKEMESQPRSGDPHGTGVVWPTIAEISLVGALGCGEYLLQMALEDIERRGSYEFAVLEATETSRPFYEKFGFVRVGAVCKYGKQEDVTDKSNSVEETGYRHWTYANETKARLNEHGGPSCMMARKIQKRDKMGRSHCQTCGKELPSFIDKLANYFVTKKPIIEPLGTSGNRKRSRAISTGSISEKSSKMARTEPSRVTQSGRQSRSPNLLEYPDRQFSKSRSSRNSTSSALPPMIPKNPTPRSSSNKPCLRKQKIANMYRDPKKIYYYNKVVTPNPDSTDASKYKSKYYFVLNFEEDVKLIRIIPLYRRGTFKGKREGREKWKATILPRNDADEKKWLKSMDVITAPASNWNIVPSYMVTKCSSVGEESWDILC